MIPISYDAYSIHYKKYADYIEGFQHRLQLAINRGYLGKKCQHVVDGILIEDKTLYLVGDDLIIFKRICTCLKLLAFAEPNKLPLLIGYFTRLGVVPGSNIHNLLKHAFINNGFDATGPSSFPKDSIVKALGVDICPYCNREGVKVIPVDKIDENGNIVTKNIKAELDHFYPKELYPYLAVSLYNLVPSCETCNHYSNKYRSDPYATGLITPFLLKDSRGIQFHISVRLEKISNLKIAYQDVKIEVLSNDMMSRNVYEFSLLPVYNSYHKPDAAQVYNIYKSAENQARVAMAQGLTSHLGTPNDIIKSERINANAHFCENQFSRVLLSKMKSDIWRQLVDGKLLSY